MKNLSPSVWFWNIFLVVVVIIITIIKWEVGLLIWGFVGSFLALGVLMDAPRNKDMENHIWIYLTWLLWIILIVMFISKICGEFKDNVISPFNSWINKQFKKG